MILLLLACTPEVPEPPGAPLATAEGLVPLDAPRLLRRMSLDLRGVLPSIAELDRVEADPDALADVRAPWLDDPRLEERLVHLLAERWHTRVDSGLVDASAYDLAPDEVYTYWRAVGEEPLRLAARVAAADRPWTDVVTADHTMADDFLLGRWPLAATEAGEGWREAAYTDGRPAAGVLATNGLWWRYATTFFNQNRGRAAAISRLLLCEDMLARPVRLQSAALLEEGGTTDAIRSDPTCLSCHGTLDPIAASLYGFWWYASYNPEELEVYHFEREPLGEIELGVSASWYGRPLSGLADLGAAIAADPRFARCAVQTFTEGLWRRPETLADFDRVEALRAGFVDGGLRVPPLLVAITDTPEYRAGATEDDGDDAAVTTVVEAATTRRVLSPDQLATAVEDLTGYRWTWEGYDQLDNDAIGYRVMLGGVDGELVTQASAVPDVSSALVVQRLAEAAAAWVVARDLGAGEGRLLTVDPAARPGDAAFAAQVDALAWRMLARRDTDAERAALLTLWTDLEAIGGPSVAWEGLVSALLRDPDFVTR